MNETSRDLLRIALDRGYLEPEVVKLVANEARVRRVSPERVLLERRILSVRRLERLRSHVRYQIMRRSDRRYAAVAAKNGVSKRAIKQALSYQKALFQKERRCIRLGSRLIEKGFVSVEFDRKIRGKAKSTRQAAVAPQTDLSSTHALPLDEESALRSNPTGLTAAGPSYEAIEAALARVEALRALRDDLSTSEPRLPDEVPADSAMELENACAALARRRARAATPSSNDDGPPAPPRGTKKLRKKSGFAAIWRRSA